MVQEMAWCWKSEMTTRNVVVDLTKGEKLYDNNYAMWYIRIQYLLNEQEVLETLTSAMIQLEKGNSTKHHRDMEAYYS